MGNLGYELLDKRTRSSKTFDLGNNKFSWDGTIGSIHYKDNPKNESEQWKEIDNIFKSALAPWNWEMLKASYHIRVKEDFTAGQIIEFEKHGETVQFQPMALEWTNDLDQIQQVSMPQDVVPVITNPEVDLLPVVGMPSHHGTIRWDNSYGEGLDFEWKCTSTRLVKILEIENINNLSIPEQYIIDGGNPVLRLNLIFDPSTDMNIYVDGELWDKSSKMQTFNIIEFRKNGEVLWGFMPLRYWGSGDNPETNYRQSVATLEKRGNKLYISIRVPYEWLQSAVYPVFIDTNVDEQVGANSDDASDDGISTEYLTTGWSNYDKKPGFRFTTVNVPQGTDNIVTAYIEVCAQSSTSSDITIAIGADDVDDSVTFSAEDLPSDRVVTSATVVWDISTASWTDDGTFYGSEIEIKTVIQEIVARDGWSADNALSILFMDSGSGTFNKRSISAREHSTTEAAQLHIEYEAAPPPPAGTTGDLGLALGLGPGGGRVGATGAGSRIPHLDPGLGMKRHPRSRVH